MSSKHGRDGEVGSESPKAGRPTWIGRVMLATVPLVVLGATALQVLHQQDEKLLWQRAEEQWRGLAEELGQAESLPRTRQTVDDLVEEAFAPVYARIPEFLDWHYSFLGQYQELGLLLLGRLEGEIESRLFGQLAERVSLARDSVGQVMQEEVLAELQRWFDQDAASLPSRLRPRYERMLEPLLADARRRVAMSVGPTTIGAAAAGIGTSVAVRTLTTKVAGRLGAGAAMRATGATLGRTVALAASAVAGVAIDFALRKVDELRNREDIERGLTTMVDEEKERVRAALSGAVEQVKSQALGDFIPARLR